MADIEKLIELLKNEDVMDWLVKNLVDNGVTVQKWTPASQPPEVWRDEDGSLTNYMVYMPEYGVDIGNFFGSANYWLCLGIPCEVTHWAPLPNPPKEAQHG